MKFRGPIGYVTQTVENGICTFTPSEINVTGDVRTFRRYWRENSTTSGTIELATVISVIETPTLAELIPALRYVKFHGQAWAIHSIEEEPPRLNLTLGEKYDGDTYVQQPDAGET